MKIAQIMAGANSGGAELFYERMTAALAATGADILPVIRRNDPRAARLRAAGLAPLQFRFGGKLDVFTRPKIRRALKNFNADLAIAWMSRAAAFLPVGNWINAGRLGGYYNLKYFRSCRHLVGNTHGIVDWIAGQGWPPANVHYLPNFVDDFATTEPLSRKDLGVPDAAPLVLALGRLHKVKGFDTLIRAAALLPDVHVMIAGEGPERAALTNLIVEYGVTERVKLLGWRNDSGALLKTANLFVSSSRHEPLGNMVLEAFSASCPVLATRAEGPSEVIRDGIDGVMVPIDDSAALADGIKNLLANAALCASLGTAGRARFEAEFSVATVTAAWLTFCNKVAG